MKKILIIEDNKHLSEIFNEVFEENGYEVNTALMGANAIKFLQTTQPDVIILDMRLPDIDGLKILEQIRNICKNKTQVIIYTAFEEYRQTCLQVENINFCTFILKPAPVETILSEVEKLLNKTILK
ncbi:MAG: response regulator [Elusimicrobia bacterium]|nr:response regulator [Elusimicrobiota bacterium]